MAELFSGGYRETLSLKVLVTEMCMESYEIKIVNTKTV